MHFRANRPNIDYFSSDLHLQMFNICNSTLNLNQICLYDERHGGKGGNEVCSLRWQYHTKLIQKLIAEGKEPPQMIIKVLDNCSAQNKSNTTCMFDCMLSLLLYDRVANFYLLTGHSHMRADQVVSLTKRALKKKDLFIPHQIAEAMSSVKHMEAEVFDENAFFEWEPFLNKFCKKMPPKFTQYYHYEFVNGVVLYKPLVSTGEDDSLQHEFTSSVQATKKAMLKELLGLPVSASLSDICKAKIQLPNATPPTMAASKVKSIASKLGCIPQEYRAYYPGYDRMVSDAAIENQAAPAQKPEAKKAKARPGRPKNPPQTSGESMLKFLCTMPARSAAETATTATASNPLTDVTNIQPHMVNTPNEDEPPMFLVLSTPATDTGLSSSNSMNYAQAQSDATVVVNPPRAEEVPMFGYQHPVGSYMELLTDGINDAQSGCSANNIQPHRSDVQHASHTGKNIFDAISGGLQSILDPAGPTGPMQYNRQCPWVMDDPGVDDSIQ